MHIGIKRVYDKPEPQDGFRILVDRIWPRGLTKEAARIDLWLRDIAPSTPLRQWFGHDPKKWSEFKRRYFAELKDNQEPVQQVLDQAKRGRVTLVFGAKDEERSNARALKEYLETFGHHK
ncbi:MAG: DUF488 domain-containing protein [Gammaproteobacteria bacterium]